MPETGETGSPCIICGYPVEGAACPWCGADPGQVGRILSASARVPQAEPVGLGPIPHDDVREERQRSEAIWSMLSPEFKAGTLGQYRVLRRRAARLRAALTAPAMFVAFSAGFWAGVAVTAVAASSFKGFESAAADAPLSRRILPVLFMVPVGLALGSLVQRLVAYAGPVRAESRFLKSYALIAFALVDLVREPWYLRARFLFPAAFVAAAAAGRFVLGLL